MSFTDPNDAANLDTFLLESNDQQLKWQTKVGLTMKNLKLSDDFLSSNQHFNESFDNNTFPIPSSSSSSSYHHAIHELNKDSDFFGPISNNNNINNNSSNNNNLSLDWSTPLDSARSDYEYDVTYYHDSNNNNNINMNNNNNNNNFSRDNYQINISKNNSNTSRIAPALSNFNSGSPLPDYSRSPHEYDNNYFTRDLESTQNYSRGYNNNNNNNQYQKSTQLRSNSESFIPGQSSWGSNYYDEDIYSRSAGINMNNSPHYSSPGSYGNNNNNIGNYNNNHNANQNTSNYHLQRTNNVPFRSKSMPAPQLPPYSHSNHGYNNSNGNGNLNGNGNNYQNSNLPALRITSRLSSHDLKRDIDLELSIIYCARAILYETPNKCLKSVELANALRDRIGKDGLQRAKTVYGGLLVLLELYPETFFVHRIPKNDMVELIDPNSPYPQNFNHIHNNHTNINQSTINSKYLMNETSFLRAPNSIPLLNGNNNNNINNGNNNYSNYLNSIPTSSPAYQGYVPTTTTEKLNLTEENIRNIKPRSNSNSVLPTRPTDQYIILTDVPENVSGSDLWNEFGGNGVVQKVSLDYQGSKRTGIIYFTSELVAKKAYIENLNNKWKNRIFYSGNQSPYSSTSSNSISLTSPTTTANSNIVNIAPPASITKTTTNNTINLQNSTNTSNVTETRLIPVRADQLPHFFQEVLRNLSSLVHNENTAWKRNIIADYLFCRVLTEMLKQTSGILVQISQLQQQLRDTFGAPILLAPLKAFFCAYPEYFEVDRSGTLVRAIKSELPPLETNINDQIGSSSSLSSSSYVS